MPSNLPSKPEPRPPQGGLRFVRSQFCSDTKGFPPAPPPTTTPRRANPWLRRSPIPKLFLWAKPGMIVRGEKAAHKVAVIFPNTETVFVGEGRHYIQEDQPDAIGGALSDWLGRTT